MANPSTSEAPNRETLNALNAFLEPRHLRIRQVFDGQWVGELRRGWFSPTWEAIDLDEPAYTWSPSDTFYRSCLGTFEAVKAALAARGVDFPAGLKLPPEPQPAEVPITDFLKTELESTLKSLHALKEANNRAHSRLEQAMEELRQEKELSQSRLGTIKSFEACLLQNKHPQEIYTAWIQCRNGQIPE